MTTITRLSIQGIRSYSDAEPQTIDFFRPLTIILGNNGCGKSASLPPTHCLPLQPLLYSLS